MKRFTALLLTAVMFLLLCSCNTDKSGNGDTDNSSDSQSNVSDETTEKAEITTVESLGEEEIDAAKVYIVYFSHKNDTVESTARFIADKTGGTLYKIETSAQYPTDEKELLKRAADEYNKNARPALKNAPTDMKDYDIVFLCFPAWCSTMPMAVWTFVEDYDMRDKAVLPVCYGSNDELLNAVRDINTLKPNMTVVSGFSYNNDTLGSAEDLSQWIDTALYGK